MAKILIVDDDAGICRKLAEMLAEAGHETATASSGKEAVKMLRKETFEVVITDLMMPGADGIEVLAEAKKKSAKTRVIIMTAFGTIENAVEAMKRGAADYITKPFRSEEILVAVKRALEEISFEEHVPASAEKIISSLDSPIRRAALFSLTRGELAFSEIMSAIKIEDATKLNFHLRKLKQDGLVEQDEDKKYSLSSAGKRALEVLRQLEG